MATVSAFAAAKSRPQADHVAGNGMFRATYQRRSAYTSDESEDEVHISTPAAKSLPRMRLSTWTPGKGDFDRNAQAPLTVRMRHAERATFIGCYDLVVDVGAVEVAGAVLCASSARLRVFAPTSSSVPSILCKTRECCLTLYSCSEGLSKLEKISVLYSTIFKASADEQLSASPRSFDYLEWSDNASAPVVALEIPRAWTSVFENILQCGSSSQKHQARVFVCGAQKCGKSTFCRAFINHAITRDVLAQMQADQSAASQHNPSSIKSVFLLDLDPGQPEFGPPGQVSLTQIASPLLGPPYSHPSCYGLESMRTIRAHTLANSTPQDDVDHYLACCSDLLLLSDRVQRQFSSAVLLINTPGWITAQGLEIMVRLLEKSKHDFTIVMGLNELRRSSEDRTAVQGTLSTASRSTQLVELDSRAPSILPSRTPAELRTMQYQSYLHLVEPATDLLRWSAMPLNSSHWMPLSLNYGKGSADVIGLLSLFEAPSKQYVASWICRSLVGICFIEDAQLAARLKSQVTSAVRREIPLLCNSPETVSAGIVPPDPAKTRFLGLAYVKDIDAEAHRITLITPLVYLLKSLLLEDDRPQATVPRLLLVAGKYESPHWAYAEDALYGKSALHRNRDEDIAISQRPYVRRLRQGEKGDLVWRSRLTSRFNRK